MKNYHGLGTHRKKKHFAKTRTELFGRFWVSTYQWSTIVHRRGMPSANRTAFLQTPAPPQARKIKRQQVQAVAGDSRSWIVATVVNLCALVYWRTVQSLRSGTAHSSTTRYAQQPRHRWVPIHQVPAKLLEVDGMDMCSP